MPAPVQDPNEFPKWKYSASKPAVVVQDKDQEKKLGAGYYDSPADIASLLVLFQVLPLPVHGVSRLEARQQDRQNGGTESQIEG